MSNWKKEKVYEIFAHYGNSSVFLNPHERDHLKKLFHETHGKAETLRQIFGCSPSPELLEQHFPNHRTDGEIPPLLRQIKELYLWGIRAEDLASFNEFYYTDLVFKETPDWTDTPKTPAPEDANKSFEYKLPQTDGAADGRTPEKSPIPGASANAPIKTRTFHDRSPRKESRRKLLLSTKDYNAREVRKGRTLAREANTLFVENNLQDEWVEQADIHWRTTVIGAPKLRNIFKPTDIEKALDEYTKLFTTNAYENYRNRHEEAMQQNSQRLLTQLCETQEFLGNPTKTFRRPVADIGNTSRALNLFPADCQLTHQEEALYEYLHSTDDIVCAYVTFHGDDDPYCTHLYNHYHILWAQAKFDGRTFTRPNEHPFVKKLQDFANEYEDGYVSSICVQAPQYMMYYLTMEPRIFCGHVGEAECNPMDILKPDMIWVKKKKEERLKMKQQNATPKRKILEKRQHAIEQMSHIQKECYSLAVEECVEIIQHTEHVADWLKDQELRGDLNGRWQKATKKTNYQLRQLTAEQVCTKWLKGYKFFADKSLKPKNFRKEKWLTPQTSLNVLCKLITHMSCQDWSKPTLLNFGLTTKKWIEARSKKKNTLVLWGPPSAAKSQIIQSIQKLFLNVAAVNRSGRDNNRFLLSACIDKQLIVFEEPDITANNVNALKALLGGDDVLTERKGVNEQQCIEQTPVAITTNTKITELVSNETEAIEERCTTIIMSKNNAFEGLWGKLHPIIWVSLWKHCNEWQERLEYKLEYQRSANHTKQEMEYTDNDMNETFKQYLLHDLSQHEDDVDANNEKFDCGQYDWTPESYTKTKKFKQN